MKDEPRASKSGRRRFLRAAARAIAGAAALLGAHGLREPGKAATAGSFPTPDYDWTKHRWAFGVDATKCIGCLRCVEACKAENGVALDAHHFRTWVERYVYLEGEDHARIDSQADPENIAASGSEAVYRFDNRYEDKKVTKAFFVPKLCNHCERPSCVQVCPTGATYKTKDGAVLIDNEYCIGCQYCVQACPYGARFFNAEKRVTEKCTWCYHRITKGLQPACVEVCPVDARIFGDLNDPDSSINAFIHDNRVQVLKPETGNEPTCFYVGIDKEVS
ncbi:MAG: 4Fe-4S dicluster domain-containing protein [Kiloniellaceae bacterium]